MMAALHWDDSLNVGVSFMDDDHREAASQINALAAAQGPQRVAVLGHFIAHCRDHFARENAMMDKTGFFALACHQDEHARVLAELETVLARLQDGHAQDSYFTTSLPAWLMQHRNTMDFVTAEFARKIGFSG